MELSASFEPLGSPLKQPRTLEFRPSNGVFGGASVQPRSEACSVEILNQSVLEELNLSTKSSQDCVKAGDVLIASKPFVFVLSTVYRGARCDGCLQLMQKQNVVLCKCKFAFYCTTSCQIKAENCHKDECELIIRRKSPPSNDTVRFVLRLLLKLKRGGLHEADIVPGLEKPRKFADLVDHFDDVIRRPNKVDNIEHCYREILSFMGQENGPPPDYFLEVYGRMAVNSFSILTHSQDSIGSGLYLGPSIFDHSCVPNAAVMFRPDATIEVRALTDMPKLDYSQIFISYIDLLDDTEHRRGHLQATYYFLCHCQRCEMASTWEKDMFSIECQECKNVLCFGQSTETVPEKTLECSHCKHEVSPSTLEEYAETVQIVRENLEQTSVPMDVASFCLTIMDRAGFAPYHILVVQATLALFDSLLYMHHHYKYLEKNNVSLLSKAHPLGLFLIKAYKKYKRHIWPCLGMHLLKMTKIERALGMQELADHHLSEAQDILCICNGQNWAQNYLSLAHI